MAGGRLAYGVQEESNEEIETTAQLLCPHSLSRRLFSDQVSSLYPVGLPSIVFREDKFAFDETWALCRLSTHMRTLTLGVVQHIPSKTRYCDPSNAAIFIDRDTTACAWHRTVLAWMQLLALQGKPLTVLDEEGQSKPLKLIRDVSLKKVGIDTAFMSLAHWQSETIARQAKELSNEASRMPLNPSKVQMWLPHSAA